MFTRRRFLQTLGAFAVCRNLRAQTYPFSLGVASGYPSPSGMVLWRRLTGVEPVPVALKWELAADEGFKSVVRSGETLAQPEWLHLAPAAGGGLEPERWYWYRFTAGDARSRVGRTRTAPAPGKVGGRMRFAFASCQQYEQGYFGAYRHIVADDPVLVVFLGNDGAIGAEVT